MTCPYQSTCRNYSERKPICVGKVDQGNCLYYDDTVQKLMEAELSMGIVKNYISLRERVETT